MPTIQYPESPNVDTAFVIQDSGKKNRALMTAAQDTSTIQYPVNPNSTKGYVTVNGKKQRVLLVADILGNGGGGGGSVDYTKVISKTKTMPVASADNADIIYMYDGVTDANYTHGYIYENVKTSTYTGTVSFEAASLSGTTVACSGDDFANFLTESGVSPLSVVSGTITYDAAGSLWVLVGKNADNETVLTFQEYQEDYEDFGFTFTGTPQDGDVVAFTCTIEEASASYAWVRVDVQPNAVTSVNGRTGVVVLGASDVNALPASTVIPTKTSDLINDSDYASMSVPTAPVLTVAGWSNNTQTVNVTGITAGNTVIVSPAPASAEDYAQAGILCTGQAAGTLTFSCDETPTSAITVNVLILD